MNSGSANSGGGGGGRNRKGRKGGKYNNQGGAQNQRTQQQQQHHHSPSASMPSNGDSASFDATQANIQLKSLWKGAMSASEGEKTNQSKSLGTVHVHRNKEKAWSRVGAGPVLSGGEQTFLQMLQASMSEVSGAQK